MGKGAKVSPGEMPDAEGRQANCVERGFESLGAALGDGGCRSWIATIVTLVVMMGACFVHALNVLPLLAQAVALVAVRATQQSGIQVIYPYGSFYFVSTTRAFWARWSRPAGQLIRRMLYTPLQGRRLCPACLGRCGSGRSSTCSGSFAGHVVTRLGARGWRYGTLRQRTLLLCC